MTLDAIRDAITALGLAWRGAFHPGEDSGLPDSELGTVVLLGFVGRVNWAAFAASPEAGDGRADPLDRWSRRVVDGLARRLAARALFPFDGPPWLPFQRWAQKAEPLHRSPLGMLIHPDWGLWHSWRGALGFREHVELPEPDRRPSPCDDCKDKPCLTACPVTAFTRAGYDVAACGAHLAAPAGQSCIEEGCAARLACPIGEAHRYAPEQSAFHMRAFRKARF